MGNNDFVDAGFEQKKAEARRYLDGLFWSGTLEEMKLHHRILSHLAKKGEKSEGRLACYLGFSDLHNKEFQAALAGLESRGLITRKTREWGFRGEWIALSDDARQQFITAKGIWLGSQNLRQLGVEV